MPFDPNLPFEEVDETDTLSFDTVSKPKATGFDFNQPFEEVEDTEDQSQFDADYFRPKPLKTEKKEIPEGQSVFRQVADVPLGIARGGVTGIKMMTDILGADNPVSKSLAGVEGYMADLMSAQAKEDQQEIARIMKDAEDKGFGEQVKAGIKAFSIAPVDIMSQALGTMAPVLATGLAGGAAKLGALGIRGIQLGVGAGMGAGMIKGEIYNEVKNELINSGTPEEVAEKAAVDAQAYGGKNLDQILLGAGLGAASTLGAEGIITRILTKQGKASTAGLVSRALKGGITEAIPEGVQAAQEQLAKNVALQREGFDVDPSRGVVAAATMEAIAGAQLGGIAGAVEQPAKVKTLEEEKFEQTNEIARNVAENGAPLTASALQDKAAANLNQDELAKKLDEELSLTAVKPSVAAPVAIPTKDDYVARYSAIAQTAPEELTRAEQAFTNELATADTEEKRVNAQNALDAIKEVKGVGLTPATQAVSPVTQEGQVDSTIFDLQSVANNTATREQISSLSLSGLVDIRKGQAIINEDGEGILAQSQAPLPKLTPEARAAEVEATTPRPLPTDVLPTETPGAEYGREAELFDVFGGVRRRPVTIEEPTIGEIPQTSPMIGEQPAEPTISEKPVISDIVGAEPATIVEQEQVAPVSQEFKDELMMSGVAYDGDTRYSVQQSSDGTFRAERIANGQREDIQIGLPDIETAQNVIINSVGKEPTQVPVAAAQPVQGVTPEKPQGMSVEEGKAYLEERNKSTIFGYPTQDIMSMQQGKQVGRAIPSAAPAEAPAITPAPVEEAIPTAEALVPPNALENIKKNPDLYEAVKKDALSGYLVPAYISNSVSSRNLPKGFSQSLIAKVKKQVGDNPFIFEIEYAIKNEIEKTAYGKEKKKADEVKLDSALQRTGETYELDVAIQDYRNKQIELERTQKSILTTPALRQVERVGAKNNLEKSKQKLIAIAAKPAPVAETPAVEEAIPTPEEPQGTRVAAAAYIAPDGTQYTGPSHLAAMQMAKLAKKITQAEIDAKQTPKSRETSEFGFKTNAEQFVTRDQAESIARQSGQLRVNKPYSGKLHSNEVALDEFTKKASPAQVPTVTQDIEVGDEASVNLAGRNETVTIVRIEDINGVPTAYFDYFGYKSRPLSEMQLAKKSKQNIAKAKAKGKVSQIEIEKPKPEDFFSNEEITSLASGKAPDGWKFNFKSRDEFPLMDKQGKRWTFEPQYINGKIASILMRAEGQYTGVTIESTPTPAVSETITPAAEPAGISVGNRVKYDNSPQTYTVEEVIPQTKEEVERDEQSYSIKNEMTGEVQVVGEMGLKKVGGKKARKMAAEVIPKQESVTPIPEDNRYTFEEAVKAVDAHFGKQGIPEGVVIVNNTTEPDLEMKAGYFVNRGQIVINLAYIAKGENLGDIIDHELGHYIFGDPEFQDNFKSFWEAMTPEEQAEADRLINQFYNKETGAVQMEEKQVRAFLQLIQDSKAMPKWKQLLDSIKRWINEKLGTNFQVTDEGALAVLAAAHKRFKSGEQIVREIDSGVLKSVDTEQGNEYPSVGININDKTQDFTGQILRGEKTIETRPSNSLKSLIGKRVGIVRTGKGKATLVGYANVGEPIVYNNAEEFRADQDKHLVEEKTKFDIKSGEKKYGYPLTDIEAIDPIEIPANLSNWYSARSIPQPKSSNVRRMAAEPRREKVAGKERGDIITTPEGIIKQTNEVLRKKFFDGSEVSDENTSAAWDYIEQLLDTKSGAAYEFAGLINNVVDQETNSDTRMGAGLFSVSLTNYAAKLSTQGDNTMISYLVRRNNRMPTDNRGGTATESGRVLRGKREYSIDGYHTITTEHDSKIERTAAALFGTGKPSEEQVAAVEAAIKESEDTSIGEPGEVAGEIEKVEKRTGRKVVKKIEDKIKESTEPKKEELLISFQNLNADKKIKGITLTYSPKKVNPSKNIKDFIIGKLVDYRKTLVNQGASGLESTFWQTMSASENKPGPLGEIDQAQNNELAKIVQKTLIDLGLKGEPPNTKMTDIEKVASILNKQKLSEEKRIEADQRIVSEIERRRESELASGSTPEAVNAKYDTILDAWNQSMSRQLNMPVSDNMLQRLINAELKEQNTKINNLIEEGDGRVVAKTKQGIVDSIIRKIYGVSKESETGIEMDENYDGLKSYLEQTLDNMYALQVEKKNAAYADRQAKISLRNNVEGQAQSIIDQLADQLSDTPAFPEKQENQVKAIVQQDLRQRPDMKRKQPWTSQLTAKLIQAGVSEAQAETISDLVWRQHEIKAMDRELKELQTAAEKGSLAVIIQRIKDTPLEEQQKPEWMQGVIREYLIEAGLSSQAADTAARLYESVIAERFAEAKQKAFEATLAKSAPWNNYLSRNAQLGKNALKRIQDAIRTGVLDPTQTTEGIIAKESGWSGFSKEQLTRIVQLDGVLSDDANNQVDKAEAMSELNKIIVKAKMPVRFRDAISAYYVAQALLGIPTFTVNIYSPTMFAIRNFAIDVAKYATTDPKMVPVAFQSFINSFKSLYDNSMYAFKNQIYMSGEIEYMQGQNILSELFDKGKAQWAKGDYANGMGNMLVGASQITGRILSSLDQGAIEMMQSQNITRYAIEAMSGNKKIPKDKRNEIVNIAITGRRKIKEDLIASGMASDRAGVLADLKVRSELMLSLSGFGIKEKDVLDAALNDALQTVGRNRAITINSLKQETKNLRDSGILSGIPIGFLEGVAQWANKGNQSQQVFAKMLYGFALVPARVFSTSLWFSPIGFVRLGVDAALKKQGIESRYAVSLATEFQQKQRFIEAIAGTVFWVGLGALVSASAGDEDDDKWFKIVVTGNGPDYNTDRQYHDSWHKKYKPHTSHIVMGKTVIPINIGRGGEAISIPLIFLGAGDDARIKEKLNQAKKSPADLEAAAEMIGSVFYSFSNRGPFSAFTKPLFDAKKQDKLASELFSQAGYFGKTFIPIVGTSLARNISDFINDPIDKSSVQGAIYSNMPIVGPMIGTKALNAFGQPIRADDWGDRLFKLGAPLAMSFPKNTPENELNELVLKKGDGPPIPTRTNAQKKFEDPLTDKEFEIYVREYGRVVSDKMFKNRKRLESMEAKNYTKELDKYVNGYSIDGTTIPGASDMAVRAIKRSRGE